MKKWEFIYKDAFIRNYVANITGKQDFVQGIRNINHLVENARKQNIDLNGFYGLLFHNPTKLQLYLKNKISLQELERLMKNNEPTTTNTTNRQTVL